MCNIFFLLVLSLFNVLATFYSGISNIMVIMLTYRRNMQSSITESVTNQYLYPLLKQLVILDSQRSIVTNIFYLKLRLKFKITLLSFYSIFFFLTFLGNFICKHYISFLSFLPWNNSSHAHKFIFCNYYHCMHIYIDIYIYTHTTTTLSPFGITCIVHVSQLTTW